MGVGDGPLQGPAVVCLSAHCQASRVRPKRRASEIHSRQISRSGTPTRSKTPIWVPCTAPPEIPDPFQDPHLSPFARLLALGVPRLLEDTPPSLPCTVPCSQGPPPAPRLRMALQVRAPRPLARAPASAPLHRVLPAPPVPRVRTGLSPRRHPAVTRTPGTLRALGPRFPRSEPRWLRCQEGVAVGTGRGHIKNN